MPLKLEDKRRIVEEVSQVVATAQSAIAAEYRGMTVAEMTQLRVQARKAGVYLRVVRNTLARRATANTPFECMKDSLVGPLVLAFSTKDPGAGARVLSDYLKTHPKLVVKSIALGGKLIPAQELDKVAKLPTLEQALSQLLAVMKAPLTQLVRTLAEPPAKLARTLAAVRDSKQPSE
jgi:large subunit ribosomal protein L10